MVEKNEPTPTNNSFLAERNGPGRKINDEEQREQQTVSSLDWDESNPDALADSLNLTSNFDLLI